MGTIAISYLAIMPKHYEYRRKLPHFQPDNKIFFITFCTDRRWVLPEEARDIVLETCIKGNGKLFRLYGAVVMHDHVHILLTPLYDFQGTVSIPEIMQAIKSTSSHRINKLLNRKGLAGRIFRLCVAERRRSSAKARLHYSQPCSSELGFTTRRISVDVG